MLVISNNDGANYTWHQGTLFAPPALHPLGLSVQADCDELDIIVENFKDTPGFYDNRRVSGWKGAAAIAIISFIRARSDKDFLVETLELGIQTF